MNRLFKSKNVSNFLTKVYFFTFFLKFIIINIYYIYKIKTVALLHILLKKEGHYYGSKSFRNTKMVKRNLRK